MRSWQESRTAARSSWTEQKRSCLWRLVLELLDHKDLVASRFRDFPAQMLVELHVLRHVHMGRQMQFRVASSLCVSFHLTDQQPANALAALIRRNGYVGQGCAVFAEDENGATNNFVASHGNLDGVVLNVLCQTRRNIRQVGNGLSERFIGTVNAMCQSLCIFQSCRSKSDVSHLKQT